MIAQRIDLFALQEIVIASALPKPIPALAAFEAVGVAVVTVPPVCVSCNSRKFTAIVEGYREAFS